MGVLFGLGFDTATEVGLLVLAGGAAAFDLPFYAVLVLPVLFAAGMCLADTLDGVLMGAGDVGYLRTLTIGSAVVGFLPLSLLSGPLDWGLAGVWTGLCLFIGLRLVGVLTRVAGDRWLAAPATVTA